MGHRVALNCIFSMPELANASDPTYVTFSAIVNDFRLLQPEKASPPMVASIDRDAISTFASLAHSMNARDPISVTPSGIAISLSWPQLRNASRSIFLSHSGSSTDSTLLLPMKASAPISVTLYFCPVSRSVTSSGTTYDELL